MKTEKQIGLLLVSGTVLVFVPYTILTFLFDYPDILRADAGEVLTRFDQGGASLVGVWWLFGMGGLPLLWAYVLIGQVLGNRDRQVRWATTLGVISGIVQIIGLMRWTFVVPVLADAYVGATTEATREAAKLVFQAVHQFGGVLLGEHLGQLFTIAWMVLMATTFRRLRLFPGWVSGWAYLAAAIYVLAQAELLATVIPGFPVWGAAGLVGSLLWLAWLVVVGVHFWKTDIQ